MLHPKMLPALADVNLQLLLMLTFDEGVAFHDAFPELEVLWTPDVFPHLLRRHLASSKHLSITNANFVITWAKYVHYYHWHIHATLNTYMMPPRYRTTVFTFAGLLPTKPDFRVIECAFLPNSAKGSFSCNLLLVGACGELLFYQPVGNTFYLRAHLQLDHVPTSLAVSPGGTTVLLGSSQNAYLVRVEPDSLETFGIDVKIDEFTFTKHCFTSETSFLHWVEKVGVVEYSLKWNGELNTHHMVKSVYFNGLYFGWTMKPLKLNVPEFFPSVECPEVPRSVVTFVPGVKMNHLVFAHKYGTNGMGGFLRVVSDPRGVFDSTYVHFNDCIICNCVPKKEGDGLYVTVIFNSERKRDFFDPANCPVVSKDELAMCDTMIYGRIGVYLLNFEEDGGIKVLPLFYMGRAGLLEGEIAGAQNVLHHPNWTIGYRSANGIQSVCTNYHFTIKVNSTLTCHFDLIATGASAPSYETVPDSTRWTISEDDDYSFYAKALLYRELYSASVECDKYWDKRIESVPPSLSEPLTSTINYI